MLLIFFGILFILQNGISLAFVAIGFWDPFEYGKGSEEFCTEIVERFFVDWDSSYLRTKYNKEAKKSGVVDLALERIAPLEEIYGRIKNIKEVDRTSFHVTAPSFIPWDRFYIIYGYEFLAEFDTGEIVLNLGVMKEGNGWGLRHFGIKSPLDDFVFVTEKAAQSVGQIEEGSASHD